MSNYKNGYNNEVVKNNYNNKTAMNGCDNEMIKNALENEVLKNDSGNINPPPGVVTTNADDGHERFHKLLNIIFKLCELSGFHLEGRITVRDDKTGKIWR